MNEVKRHIAATPAQRADLSKRYHVTPQSVGRALHYERDSAKAQRIRNAAKNDGCIEYITAPMCETIHDACGMMRQYFPKKVVIEVNKANGHCVLLKDEQPIKSWDNVTITMLEAIQKEAAQLCGAPVTL